MSEFYPGNAFESENEWGIPTQRFMEEVEVDYIPIRFHEEDDDGVVDIECSSRNTQVILNLIRDDLDAITVADERTDPPTSWIFFRDELEPEQWSWVTDALAKVAIQVQTTAPMPWLVDLYVNRQLKDVSITDSYPEGWDYEVPA